VLGLEQGAVIFDNAAQWLTSKDWYGLLPPKLPHPTGWLVARAAVANRKKRLWPVLDSGG